MFRRGVVILILIIAGLSHAHGQHVTVHGKFQRDSIKIGESVPFSLTVRYPAELNVILPDTTFSFAPFEFEKKKYFPTRTENHVSYDSVVYFLTTYEVDSIQKLQLPAFVINARDCTKVFSDEDAIILKQLVKAMPDSLTTEKLPLKTNTDYLNVRWLLNYPLYMIIVAVLLVLLIAGWIIFGKRIRRHFALKRLAKSHADFILRFTQSVEQLKQGYSAPAAEHVFVIWKKYMESLVGRPFTRFTAREIQHMEHDEKLGQALQSLNKLIYAGVNAANEEPFSELRAYTEDQFVKKLEKVKHG